MSTDLASTFFSPGAALSPLRGGQSQQAKTLAQAPVPQEDQQRKEAMKEAWKAYRGALQKPLKVEADQPDDNVLSNRCAPIVDKGVSFLFGQVLQIECDEQDFIDGTLGDDDDRMTLLSQMAINGGVTGQVFTKVIPAQGDMQYPRVIVMDSQLVRIVTAPDDCSCHLAYVIEYPGNGDMQKRQIIARVDPNSDLGSTGPDDMEDSWTITNYVKKGSATQWTQVDQEDWPYPFAPILTCQNLPAPNEAWGRADLTPDIIEMNKVLNFVQSNTSRIIKYHAHPKTWGKGFKASQMNIAVNEVIVLDSLEGTLENLEMKSDLSSSLNFAATLRSDMDEQSRVPAVALGRLAELPRGNISGVALQLLFQPLLEKTVQKQRLYGKLIREICRAALVLSNKISVQQYEDYEVNLHWQDLLPADDLAGAQVALIYKQLGISDQTIMQRLGFNPDEEMDKSAEEDQKKLDMFSKGQGMPPMPPGQQQPGQAPQPSMPMMQQQGGNQQP